MKNVFLGLMILGLLSAGCNLAGYRGRINSNRAPNPINYKECLSAGGEITKNDFPQECTYNGKVYKNLD